MELVCTSQESWDISLLSPVTQGATCSLMNDEDTVYRGSFGECQISKAMNSVSKKNHVFRICKNGTSENQVLLCDNDA